MPQSSRSNSPNQHQSIDALDSNYRIDDRWTESKLIAAGYEYKGDKACQTCGSTISFYKRERSTDYKGKPHWLVLNEGVLDVHRCQGR